MYFYLLVPHFWNCVLRYKSLWWCIFSHPKRLSGSGLRQHHRLWRKQKLKRNKIRCSKNDLVISLSVSFMFSDFFSVICFHWTCILARNVSHVNFFFFWTLMILIFLSLLRIISILSKNVCLILLFWLSHRFFSHTITSGWKKVVAKSIWLLACKNFEFTNIVRRQVSVATV